MAFGRGRRSLAAKTKATPLPHSLHPAANGGGMQGMGEDFSPALLSYKS